MGKLTVLLLCGGGGPEHSISVTSAKFIKKTLEQKFEILFLEMKASGEWLDDKNQEYAPIRKGLLSLPSKEFKKIDFAIPCIHGYPGETGDIQSMFEILSIPFLGVKATSSMAAFNKICCKQWLTSLEIPNVPYFFIWDKDNSNNLELILEKRKTWPFLFLKPSSQGSSLGCLPIKENTSKIDIQKAIDEGLELSPYVLIEKGIKGRELEIATYEWEGKIVATHPSEIIVTNNSENFYSYEEKYSEKSATKTLVKAPNLSDEIVEKMKEYAMKAFKGLNLRHLSRIDFFLDEHNEIYLNEINTFPGMTPISMFPQMMMANGHSFETFLSNIINKELGL